MNLFKLLTEIKNKYIPEIKSFHWKLGFYRSLSHSISRMVFRSTAHAESPYIFNIKHYLAPVINSFFGNYLSLLLYVRMSFCFLLHYTFKILIINSGKKHSISLVLVFILLSLLLLTHFICVCCFLQTVCSVCSIHYLM